MESNKHVETTSAPDNVDDDQPASATSRVEQTDLSGSLSDGSSITSSNQADDTTERGSETDVVCENDDSQESQDDNVPDEEKVAQNAESKLQSDELPVECSRMLDADSISSTTVSSRLRIKRERIVKTVAIMFAWFGVVSVCNAYNKRVILVCHNTAVG
jgi:hypothetical protein